MTDLVKLDKGLVTAIDALADVLEAEAGEQVHYLSAREYTDISKMIHYLTGILQRKEGKK